MVDDRRTLTFSELHEAARRSAGWFIANGLDAGGRVAICAPNSIDWAVASFGVHFAGGVVVPVNARYTGAEIDDIVRRSGARLLTAAELDRRGDDAVVDARLEQLDGAAISHVQYTSGTTGRPKGAMLRHGAMVRTTRAWVAATGLGPGDRYPIIAPFSHIGGHKTGLLAGVVSGATTRPVERFDDEGFGRLVDEWPATFLQGPPTVVRSLLARRRPPATIRTIVTGAASIPPSLVEEARRRLGDATIFTAYGLTEATGVCTITASEDPPEIVARTSGRPIEGVEIRIGARDEILVRGDNVMAGYLDDPGATAEAIVDGWLHTGDVGIVDDGGYLRIVDRLTDVIIVGGMNVYPAEIESALLDHPAIEQAAVVAGNDERLGEVPVAFVVASRPVNDGDVLDGCRARLAGFKVPRRLHVVDTLPLNAAGKVVKHLLRDP